MPIDLHTHTTASDGLCSPSTLVRLASEAGLSTIAVTDHDSVDGIEEALQAGSEYGLTVIPGVELSSDADGKDVHVLGYFIDHTSQTLREQLAALRDARRLRAERMVTALTEGGYPLTIQDVLHHAGGGAIGRAHVGRALVALGHAETMEEAFQRFIGHGRPFYVKKPLAHPREVCALIRDSGGLPVIAHPAISRAEDLVPDLIDAGLAGVEVYHTEHGDESRARLLQLAQRHGLLVTGGSDFHGQPGGAVLGAAGVPDDVLEPLLQAAGR